LRPLERSRRAGARQTSRSATNARAGLDEAAVEAA
jgi:hypothetical protein